MENSGKENEELAQSTLSLRWSSLLKISSPRRSSPQRICPPKRSPHMRTSFLKSFCLSCCQRCCCRKIVLRRSASHYKNLFEGRPAVEQPPCGLGEHKLEEGSFKERLARFCPRFRGVIHGRNLSNEEMIQAADELEEMKRVLNKLMIMHWRAKRNRPYPI